jgi:LexA-binding, inner membrane-associated putative hydrolase
VLPPGHLAGGYLAAYGLLKLAHPALDPSQTNTLLFLGALFGFAPDLDTFIAFVRSKAWVIEKGGVNHRTFVTHAPLLWLAIGLAIFLLGHDPFTKMVGMVIWLGSWSHFALDSLQYGIMWLWPFSNEVYALADREIRTNIPDHSFWGYWTKFLLWYAHRLSFYLEILVVLSALFIFSSH